MDYMISAAPDKEKKITLGKNFYISITPEIYQELMAYVNHYSTEVSGCGMVNVIRHNDGNIEYAISEVFLPDEQENSGARTEIDDKVVHNIIQKLVRENVDTSRLRMHWHSHVNMNVFHSTTDEENYATLHQQDFYVSLVLNKKKDILGRVDLAIPFTVTVVGVPVYIKVPSASKEATKDRIKANIEALDKYIEENKKDDWRDRIGFGSGSRDRKSPVKVITFNKKKKNKKNKHKSKHIYKIDEELSARKLELQGYLDLYTSFEKRTYGECTFETTGIHTCYNPVECNSYNEFLKEIKDLRANGY